MRASPGTVAHSYPGTLHPSRVADADLWRDRRLPEAMREELRVPLGRLMSGAAAYRAVRAAPKVVTVGDACTGDLAKRGRIPDVAVVDYRTRRSEDAGLAAAVRGVGAKVLTARSPAATLTRELWAALDEAFKSGERVRVEVLGEEDLAALAAIVLAPEGTAVLYGQPGEGVVVVTVDAAAKAKVRDLLSRMV